MKKRISTLLMVMFALFTCHQTTSAQTAAQIYFEQTEVSYDLSLASTEPFVAPKLINPDGVQVWYQSSDYSTVQVGYYDGSISIFKEGVVEITASSYDAGTAKYTLTVTDSREGSGISFDIEEIVYDITSGEDFVAPVLNNPNNVPVIYTCNNWSVASVDYVTGAVTINGVGEAIIGASSDAIDNFKPTTAQYKLKVTDPEIIYSANFSTDECGWTEECTTSGIWNWNFYGYMYCDGSWKVNETTDCYLVSPELQLEATGNIVSFDHMASGFNNFSEQAHFVIREIGGEWTDCGTLTVPGEWTFENTGKIMIPEEFNGKKIQLAFKYTTDGNQMCGQWYVKNIFLKKYIKKDDPQISFDVTEITHDLNDTFEAPVLNNPNNVIIEYGTLNTDIATVDINTGDVTFYGEGDVIITAKSKENKKFESATVSYTIHVTDNSKIFKASFMEDLCGFTEEGPISNIWKFSYGYALASDENQTTEPTECFMVSPEITLKTNNTFEFEQMPQDYYGYELTDIAKFAIRESNGETKGEWTYITLNYPEAGTYYTESTGIIEIPAEFNNKTVQVAFMYVANGSVWKWWIRNLVIHGIQAEKTDPEISFAEGDVEAVLGQEFTAPALNNPNNVEVVYSSNKPEVATVDPQTGAVTLVSEGFTTITATSVENEQYVSASVNYVLTVLPAEDINIIFKEKFETDLGDFTMEGEGAQDVWTYYYGAAHADGYNKVPAETVSYLVSPVITLAKNNIVTFDYSSMFFAPERVKTDMMISVRLVNGEWTDIELPVAQAETESDTYISAGDIVIPSEFDGKEVQIALRYVSAGVSSGIWYVRNFVVKKNPVKIDPELSFPETEYTYLFGPDKFVAPELSNPYGVEVLYSSDNYDVADVDPYTGEVYVYNYGTVVITAKFEGNDEYSEDSASYTLIVTDIPTGIDGITADDLKNGKVYNLQGIRVDKLGKGVYIVNGKKVVVK